MMTCTSAQFKAEMGNGGGCGDCPAGTAPLYKCRDGRVCVPDFNYFNSQTGHGCSAFTDTATNGYTCTKLTEADKMACCLCLDEVDQIPGSLVQMYRPGIQTAVDSSEACKLSDCKSAEDKMQCCRCETCDGDGDACVKGGIMYAVPGQTACALCSPGSYKPDSTYTLPNLKDLVELAGAWNKTWIVGSSSSGFTGKDALMKGATFSAAPCLPMTLASFNSSNINVETGSEESLDEVEFDAMLKKRGVETEISLAELNLYPASSTLSWNQYVQLFDSMMMMSSALLLPKEQTMNCNQNDQLDDDNLCPICSAGMYFDGLGSISNTVILPC